MFAAIAVGAIVGNFWETRKEIAGNKSETVELPKKTESEEIANLPPTVKSEEQKIPQQRDPAIGGTLPKSSVPVEIEKTRALLERIRKFIEEDARRAAFVCSGNPCRIQTLIFEEDNTHLDCGGGTLAPAEEQKVGVIIKASGVIIENCVFDGFDTAIEIEGDNAILYKNTIRNNAGNGINIEGQKATVLDNIIEKNFGIGIFIGGESNEHAIVHNQIKNNGTQGLHILGAGGITVDNNTITGNKSEGIWLSGNARDNFIYGNTIQGNGGDCTVFLSKIGQSEPQNNRIESNKVDKSIITCK